MVEAETGLKTSEIIVADGHSTDRTRQIAEELEVRVILDNGKGKGDAIRCAIQEAKGEIIVFLDADGSGNVEDIPDLVAPIARDEADMVIGSRSRGGSDELHGDLGKLIRVLGSDIILIGIGWKTTALVLLVSTLAFLAFHANYLQRGVWVGPGRHRIVMEFLPASLKHGLALTALGLIVLGGMLFFSRNRTPGERRRSLPASRGESWKK